MAAAPLYYESIRVGADLPVLAKPPIDRVQLARYAAATGNFDPLHVDEPYAKSIGMPSVMAPTSLGMGFLAQLVSQWAPTAQIRRLSAKFVRTLWPEDSLVCRGRVSDRQGQGGRYFIDLDVWAENQQGGLVLRGHVTLKVFYSAEDEARARQGQPPLVLNTSKQQRVSRPVSPRAEPAAPARKARAPRRLLARKARSPRK